MSVAVSAHCPACDARRAFECRETSHILHLLLSSATLGLWFPVWIFIAWSHSREGARCTTCASPLPPLASRRADPAGAVVDQGQPGTPPDAIGLAVILVAGVAILVTAAIVLVREYSSR